jgi:hypothetical protein
VAIETFGPGSGGSRRASFGVSTPTAHRRFSEWVDADVFGRLHQLLLDILGSTGQIDWSRAAVDSLSVRAVKGGT